MIKQIEDALKAAFQKANDAQDKVEAAIKTGDKEGTKHCCSEYGCYCELFGQALGISFLIPGKIRVKNKLTYGLLIVSKNFFSFTIRGNSGRQKSISGP